MDFDQLMKAYYKERDALGIGKRDSKGNMKTDQLCERTHAIKDEPRQTYFARYPKAVGVWLLKTKAGQKRMALCLRCAHRYMREGWIPK
jgi:hypothetical protein